MSIQAITAQFDLQTNWLLNALETTSDEESNQLLRNNLNSVKWIAGHVTDARMTLLSILSGSPVNADYKKLFGKGTPTVSDHPYPELNTILTAWKTVSEALITALKSLPDERLLEKPPFQTSIPDETLSGLIAYFAIHESFHIGQLSILRKLMEKPAMEMRR